MKTKIESIHRSFGSPAFAAVLLLAGALAVPAQNLFVANWYAPGTIYEFTPAGTESTFYSGGLGEPESLVFDSESNLFVADSLAGNVFEITPDGTKTTFASGMGDVNALAFNNAGDLFVSDYTDGNIYEFTPGGSRSTFASGLNQPQGLAFDKAGDLFASDRSGNIYEYTPGGARDVFASGLAGPSGLAFNTAGDLFVGCGGTGVGSGSIVDITPAGVKRTFATGLYNPNYLAFDTAGNLFVADGTSGVIEITPGGTISTFATGLGNTTGLAFQPVPASPIAFNAVVTAVSISTSSAGNLTYRPFGNQDLIRECANQMGLTNLRGLYLVYDLTDDALEVVTGNGANRTVICAPMAFSGGVFLGNTNATKSERQAWVYWEGNPTPVGTLTATELYGYGVSNKLVRFDLSGELQFALPGNGTNAPTIYQGSVTAGSQLFVPVVF